MHQAEKTYRFFLKLAYNMGLNKGLEGKDEPLAESQVDKWMGLLEREVEQE